MLLISRRGVQVVVSVQYGAARGNENTQLAWRGTAVLVERGISVSTASGAYRSQGGEIQEEVSLVVMSCWSTLGQRKTVEQLWERRTGDQLWQERCWSLVWQPWVREEDVVIGNRFSFGLNSYLGKPDRLSSTDVKEGTVALIEELHANEYDAIMSHGINLRQKAVLIKMMLMSALWRQNLRYSHMMWLQHDHGRTLRCGGYLERLWVLLSGDCSDVKKWLDSVYRK